MMPRTIRAAALRCGCDSRGNPATGEYTWRSASRDMVGAGNTDAAGRGRTGGRVAVGLGTRRLLVTDTSTGWDRSVITTNGSGGARSIMMSTASPAVGSSTAGLAPAVQGRIIAWAHPRP